MAIDRLWRPGAPARARRASLSLPPVRPGPTAGHQRHAGGQCTARSIEEGKFGALHDWLKESIYQHGRKFTADELLRRVTGGGLDIAPYIRYLRGKYGEMYTL